MPALSECAFSSSLVSTSVGGKRRGILGPSRLGGSYGVILSRALLRRSATCNNTPDSTTDRTAEDIMPTLERNSYLVDPASSHMLVSKIKPCMCKYKLFCTVKLRMAH